VNEAQRMYEQLSSGKPVQVQVKSPRVLYNSHTMTRFLRFETERDLWDAMEALQRKGLIMNLVMWVQPDEEGEQQENAPQTDAPKDEEKANSGQPERKNGTPTQRKGRGKTPKTDSRTVEQQTNGDAWSRLLHRTPEFLACPGVREVILEHSLAEDEHAAMRAEFNVEHLSDVDEDAALTRFIAPNAQHHIRAAWRAARAKIEARIGKRDNR